MWKRIFNRNHFGFGLLLGLLFPALLWLLLYALDILILSLFHTHILAKQEYLYILSLAINLLTIRYYFVNLKYDKTGRGILLVTFVYGIAYFVLFLN